MSTRETGFEQIEQALAEGGVEAVLDRLVGLLRERKQYHRLFEALKMRVRHRLGLPLLPSGDAADELDEPRRSKLEDGLIDACREVGLLLLREGSIRDGWMFLRPVGEVAEAARELANIEAHENNLEELVEVALCEGVDVRRGYGLVLDNYGTCNAITMFESTVARHGKADQQVAAGMLVQHVHKELMTAVIADIARQEGAEPAERTLGELVAHRDWLFRDHSYHIDATHLASTVRYSRILEDETQLRLAIDLTEHGRRLRAPFQHAGEEPFVDFYPTHARYLGALLGDEVDEAVAYFRRRAGTLDPAEHGSYPTEVCAELLSRLGRYSEAIDDLIQLARRSAQSARLVPRILELSLAWGNYDKLIQYCREHHDLLGFTTGLVHGQSSKAVV